MSKRLSIYFDVKYLENDLYMLLFLDLSDHLKAPGLINFGLLTRTNCAGSSRQIVLTIDHLDYDFGLGSTLQ